MDDLSEEERAELATYEKNPRRVESARKAGKASAQKPNSGRFEKGSSRAREMGRRGYEALKVSR